MRFDLLQVILNGINIILIQHKCINHGPPNHPTLQRGFLVSSQFVGQNKNSYKVRL